MQRVNIDYYNSTNRPKELVLKSVANNNLLEANDDYVVAIEKLEVPINNQYMPINASSIPFKFGIFNESKIITTDGLEYGFNEFEIKGPFYSVDEFLKQINDITLKVCNLGQFVVDETDDFIYFSYNKNVADRFEFLKIYFDYKTTKLLTFNFDLENSLQVAGEEYFLFNEVTNYTIETGSAKIKQKTLTFPKFYTLKSIRIYSDLPTIPYKINDFDNNSLVDSDLLTEIVFNSQENYRIENLIYIPNVFRHYSLQKSNPIRSLSLRFFYKYANGEEIALFLSPLEYASITLAFIPLSKMVEEII